MPTARSGRGIAPPKATLTELRARIRALEQGQGPDGPAWSDSVSSGAGTPEEIRPGIVPLGVPAIDRHLPDGGLRLAGLHEIVGARDEWDDAVAAGFCLALLGRVSAIRSRGAGPIPGGAILWAAQRADLYGPGVAGLMEPQQDQRVGGFPPGRLVLVRARRDAEVFWALEEGLRAPASGYGGGVLSAVVGEAGAPDDTALRRLQLAAETAGRPCFLLRRRLYGGRDATPGSPHMSTSAVALTRWRVGALPSMGPSAETGLTGLPGRPRWRLDLLRCRGAAPGTFTVEWDDAAGDFALAAPVFDRPLAQETGRGRTAAPNRRAG